MRSAQRMFHHEGTTNTRETRPWLKKFVKKQCQGRSSEDVADAILSLVTGSSMLTGQTIVVDRGLLFGSTS